MSSWDVAGFSLDFLGPEDTKDCLKLWLVLGLLVQQHALFPAASLFFQIDGRCTRVHAHVHVRVCILPEVEVKNFSVVFDSFYSHSPI